MAERGVEGGILLFLCFGAGEKWVFLGIFVESEKKLNFFYFLCLQVCILFYKLRSLHN